MGRINRKYNLFIFFYLIIMILLNFSIWPAQISLSQIKENNIQSSNRQSNSKNMLSMITDIVGLHKIIAEYNEEYIYNDIIFEKSKIIKAIAYAPDGKSLAIVNEEGNINICDISTKKILKNFVTGLLIHSIAFSPNGLNIASGNSDTSINIWDINKGGNKQLIGHTNPVYCISYSPDGKFLASGSVDKTIRIWDLSVLASIKIINTNGIITALGYSTDGKYLAYACLNSKVDNRDEPVWFKSNTYGDAYYDINIIELNSGDLVQRLETKHTERLSALIYCHNSKYLVSGSYDKTLLIWDLKTNSCIQKFQDNDSITSVAYSSSPLGKYLAYGIGNMIKIWKNNIDILMN